MEDKIVSGESLESLVNFAIEKEQDAVDFYNDLAAKAKNETIKTELLKIKVMEEQHRDRLKHLDTTILIASSPKAVVDLKMADYVVKAEPSDDMSWQDILTIAMHREAAAMKLYQNLAAKITDAQAKQLFEVLAKEEGAHKLYFEKIWDEEVMTEN